MPDEPQKQEPLDTLVLALNRKTMELTFGGDVWEAICTKKNPRAWDVCLDMLDHARRMLDVQYRIVAAMEAQAMMKQAQEEAAMRQSIMGRGSN
jgi:hypothetical protein